MRDNFSNTHPLKGKDILLLLIYFPGGRDSTEEGIVGMTRLTKAMFLFEQEIKKDFKVDNEAFPEFMAWKFGPWSEKLPDDIEFFKGIGFISIGSTTESDEMSSAEEQEVIKWNDEMIETTKSEVNEMYRPIRICMTPTGRRFVESRLLPGLSNNQLEILKNFKKKISTLSLFSLLSYVYKKYSKTTKDWTSESEIKDKILGSSRD